MRRYANIKWTKTGLRLMEEAVEIWRDRAAGKVRDNRCPLCIEYRNHDCEDLDCKECPICKFTGQPNCRETPYKEWYFARFWSSSLQAAQEEHALLKRLAAHGRKTLKVKS